ncbi:TIGR00366 family protein, partial [Priestia megaterium]
MALSREGGIEMVEFWGRGFWKVVGFGMEMRLVVVTGDGVARSAV